MADEEVIRGGRELAQALQSFSPKFEKNVMRQALRAGAAVIRDAARANVPVDDGLLRKSVRVSTSAKGGVIKAVIKAGNAQAFYAHMVEYGTKPHLIKVREEDRPINYKLTQKRGVLTRVSIKTMNRHALRIGNHFVGPSLKHPGARAKPFMRPALDDKSGAAVQAVSDKVRERLTNEGINVPIPESNRE